MNYRIAIRGSAIAQAAARQGVALLLSALMVMVPMGQSSAYAQEPLPGVTPLEEQQQGPPPADYDRGGDDQSYDQPDYGQAPDQRNQPPDHATMIRKAIRKATTIRKRTSVIRNRTTISKRISAATISRARRGNRSQPSS